jgi:hypothetical protein
MTLAAGAVYCPLWNRWSSVGVRGFAASMMRCLISSGIWWEGVKGVFLHIFL